MTTKEKTTDDLEARRIFPEGVNEKFVAALGQYLTLNNDVNPVIMRGISIGEDGQINADDCFNNGMIPMISKLSKRVQTGTNEEGKPTFEQKIKAIVISPIPTLDALLEHAEGREWIENKLETELAHITMRNLRDEDDLSDTSIIDTMPKDIDSFINAKRSGGKADNEAFNETWKLVLDALKRVPQVSDLLASANLKKSILERCLKNAAYAKALYAPIENARIFEAVLGLMIKESEKEGYDTAIVKNWLETRNDQTYEVEAFDLDSFDLDSLIDDEEEDDK